MDEEKDNVARVTIYGQEYTVKGKAEQSYIVEVAKYVNEKMEEVESSLTTVQSPLRVAILAAMNITDELFSTRKERDDVTQTVERRSKSLIDLIDNSISE